MSFLLLTVDYFWLLPQFKKKKKRSLVSFLKSVGHHTETEVLIFFFFFSGSNTCPALCRVKTHTDWERMTWGPMLHWVRDTMHTHLVWFRGNRGCSQRYHSIIAGVNTVPGVLDSLHQYVILETGEICSATWSYFLACCIPFVVLHTLECLLALHRFDWSDMYTLLQAVLKQWHGIFSSRMQHRANQRLPEGTNSREEITFKCAK